MMFPRCFILLSLIIACGTTEAFNFHQKVEKNQPPIKAKQHVSEESPRASICNWVECPKYRLVKKYSGFEHREYDATLWISTPVTLNEEGIGAGYMNLLKYINGSNSEGMHLNITSPVEITCDSNSDSEPKEGSISIFLSANLKNPPVPLQLTSYLVSFPKASHYVKSFGGIAKKEDFAKNIKALAAELTELGLEFDRTFFVCNIYDPPTELSNHHNEVWVLAAIE